MDATAVENPSTTNTEPSTKETPSPKTSPSSETKAAARSERSAAVMNALLGGKAPPQLRASQRQASQSSAADARPSQSTSETPRTTASETPESTDAEPKATETPDATAKTITLTEAELTERITRAAQAEADRREAKRNRETAQQTKARDEQERIRQLRDDPWAAAPKIADELEAEITQRQRDAQLVTTVETVEQQYDRSILDPLVLALPETVRAEILKANAHLVGLASRAAITQGALKALEKHWRADERTKALADLRTNPAVRKELLAELRGERDEPETVSAALPRSTVNMNDFLVGATSRGRRF